MGVSGAHRPDLVVDELPFRGELSGTAPPGSVVEAINLTNAPHGSPDAVEVGRADATGRFRGRLTGSLVGSEVGDILHLRARLPGGEPSPWTAVRVRRSEESDPRPAPLAPGRARLRANADDTITFEQSAHLSEPGALLALTNERTGERRVVRLDERGALPDGTSFPGRRGDSITLAASDGVHNQDFGTVQARWVVPRPGERRFVVDLRDPAPLAADRRYVELRRFTGPLVAGLIEPADVRQGALPNCYFAAAVAALAQRHPDVLRDMIRANEDGSYTVRFHKLVYDSSGEMPWAAPVHITIDADLYESFSGPRYGQGANDASPERMELWFPLLEKAYAILMASLHAEPSYERFERTFGATEVFEHVLGRLGDTLERDRGWAKLWSELSAAVAEGRPATVGTPKTLAHPGLIADHAYTVLSVRVDEHGQRAVQLRNPWGRRTHEHDDQRGVFWLSFEQLEALFSRFDTVRRP